MIGTRLAHYEITGKLGEGGMGVVYQARYTRLDRFVAIKLLPPERVEDIIQLKHEMDGSQERVVWNASAAGSLGVL